MLNNAAAQTTPSKTTPTSKAAPESAQKTMVKLSTSRIPTTATSSSSNRTSTCDNIKSLLTLGPHGTHSENGSNTKNNNVGALIGSGTSAPAASTIPTATIGRNNSDSHAEEEEE